MVELDTAMRIIYYSNYNWYDSDTDKQRDIIEIIIAINENMPEIIIGIHKITTLKYFICIITKRRRHKDEVVKRVYRKLSREIPRFTINCFYNLRNCIAYGFNSAIIAMIMAAMEMTVGIQKRLVSSSLSSKKAKPFTVISNFSCWYGIRQ